MDGLRRFLILLEEGGNITNASDLPLSAQGLPYYSVEVTFENGTQYALQAFGDEAIVLYHEVMKCLEEKKAAKTTSRN
jgi:hypothetical protein